jgi:hypothetical protein
VSFLTAEATHQAESAKYSEEIYNKPSVTADRRIATGGKRVRKRAIHSAALPVTLHNVTLAGFETLRTGMSLADVERVLRASGTELSRSERDGGLIRAVECGHRKARQGIFR